MEGDNMVLAGLSIFWFWYQPAIDAVVEETSNAMALDGIMFEGVSVRVRRPTDYNPVAAAVLGPSEPNPSLNVQAIGLQPGGSGMVSLK